MLPYVLPGASYGSSTEETEGVFEAGMDFKYGVTPNLTADLTVNTDFAQVEADQEQVNLTRFSLFFPEQRPFFLEGASIFDVGIPRPSFRRPPPLLLFYSRRIGLAGGRAIPILGGGKMTGKIGPYGIGILNVFTDKYEKDASGVSPENIFSEPRTNYSVVRVNRDILKGSTVGGILINKQDADAYNRTAGLDFSYRPTREINIQGLFSRTFEDFEVDVDRNSNAFFIGGDWRTNLFRLDASYTDIGEDFNPEVGYIQRRDVRRFRGDASYTPWPDKFGIREIQIGPEVDIVLTQANELETQEITFETDFEFDTGDDIGFQVKNTVENLDVGFNLQGQEIPEGDYNFTSFQVSGRTSSSRMVAARLQVEFGEFYSGTRRGFLIDAIARPTARLSIEPFIEFNRITLLGEEFDANAFGGRVGYSFSTILFAKLFSQWSTDRDILSANVLVNYIYRPGSDIYFVFDQSYDTRDGGVKLLGWTVLGKMTYWWNR